MTRAPRRLLAWGLGLALGVTAACSEPVRPADPAFVEGQVAPPGSPRLFADTETAPQLSATDIQRLRRLEGLRVLVRAKDGQLSYVNPATAEWRRLEGAVDWWARSGAEYQGATAACAAAANPTGCLDREVGIRMSAVQAEYRDLGFTNQDRGESLGRVTDALDSIVSLVERNVEAVKPDDQRRRFISAAATARATLLDSEATLKLYGGGVEHTPAYYNAVWRNSRSAAAIKDVNERVGTAFLVAPDWVVTCRHVVVGRDRRYMKVVFDYEEDAEGRQSQGTECDFVSDAVTATEAQLDLAAVRFRCQRSLVPPLASRAVRFSDRVAERDEPVYAIGHPYGNFKRVADNAHLRFPYQVTPPTRDILEKTIETEGQKYDEIRPAVPQMIRDFREWYQRDGQFYFYRTPGTRWNMPGKITHAIVPVAGFDTNTTHGNSGSAVFSGRDHTVVAMVFAGAGDSDRYWPYTFMRHEGGVPAVVVREWLRSQRVLR